MAEVLAVDFVYAGGISDQLVVEGTSHGGLAGCELLAFDVVNAAGSLNPEG